MFKNPQSHPRLFQNFSFWNSYLELGEKPGSRPVFPRACSKPTGFWNKLIHKKIQKSS
jgi:hypothetical protein